MKTRSGTLWWPLAALVVFVVCLAGAGWWYFWSDGPKEPAGLPEPEIAEPKPIPLLPLSESPFLNTREGIQFVGTAKCQECHPKQHATYEQTGHSRAMSGVRPENEPPDGEVFHELSRRKYRVSRKDGKLWHEESYVGPDQEEVKLAEYPLEYVTGSGRFAKTYLIEADGFLAESPLTWYGKKNGWEMSPGYDKPAHFSFHRGISWECLYCHAGWMQREKNSSYRYEIVEQTISCERCHGPGELHVKRQETGDPPAEEAIDHTIVNPKHLDRELSESICRQCHLNGDAHAAARGVSWEDFRPGRPLSDYRHEYRLAKDDGEMSVVGHVEQLHQSRCYQMSGTLTCITCHQMHRDDQHADNPVSAGKASCLKCHTAESCTEPIEKRRHVPAAEDCIACHMPPVDTDIPHFAFRHHRIGIHKESAEASSRQNGTARPLVSMQDLSRFPVVDRERSLGLAYMHYYKHNTGDPNHLAYRGEAKFILAGVKANGLKDADVDASLGQIALEEGRMLEAISLAEHVLKMKTISPEARETALFIQAQGHLAFNQHKDAVRLLGELTRIRRNPVDWALLAISHERSGNLKAAAKAYEETLKIDPGQGLSHRQLAAIYGKLGDMELAKEHEEKAKKLPLTGFP